MHKKELDYAQWETEHEFTLEGKTGPTVVYETDIQVENFNSTRLWWRMKEKSSVLVETKEISDVFYEQYDAFVMAREIIKESTIDEFGGVHVAMEFAMGIDVDKRTIVEKKIDLEEFKREFFALNNY